MKEYYHTIIGLPESGKTTFLAALWHVVNSNEISTELALGEHTGDHEYLNAIAESWRACKRVPRTSRAEEKTVLVKLNYTKTDSRLHLSFPDLSGETFESQFASRTCEPSYIEGISKGGGILVFLTANFIVDGITLLNAGQLVDEDEGSDTKPEQELEKGNEQKNAPTAWDAKVCPRQVKIVEVLQFLRRQPFATRKYKIGIVISAWDMAPKGSKPSEWLKEHYPLLEQFLKCNADDYETEIFGVSAQGGDLKNEGAKLQKVHKASERIICVEPSGASSHDITKPLVWLSSGG